MTRLEDGSVLYCTYGTLRLDHGNCKRILQGREGVEHLGTIETPANYTMYSMGGFPGVAEGGQTPIVVDVFKVKNEAVMRNVNGLEGYSGVRNDERNWYDTCDVQTEWGVANMFTMNELNNEGNRRSIITTGDWTKR